MLKFVEALTSGTVSRRLHQHNVTLKFGYISVYTTKFNHRIEEIAFSRRRLLFYWFSIGAVLGLVGLLLSVILLSANLFHFFRPYFPPTDPVFRPFPRIPFVLHRPPWVPSSIWSRFLPSDHHHSAVLPSHLNSPDLHLAALRWRVNQWLLPSHRPNPPPPDGGCAERIAAFRREIDSVVWIPSWFKQRKKRSRSLKLATTSRMLKAYHNFSRSTMRHVLAAAPQGDTDNLNDAVPLISPVPRVISAPRGDTAFLTPLIPGVTVPTADALPMLVAVLVAAVVHELGHALAAAASSGGGVSAMGAFVALIVPGAFVRLTGITDMTPSTQLRVYCAGAWHNAISAAIALFTVSMIPNVAGPFFHTRAGALVVNVPPISPLSAHLHPGDVVTAIGTSVITDGGESFRSAVRDLAHTRSSIGFCVSHKTLNSLSQGTACCSSGRDVDSVQCFRPIGFPTRGICLDATVLATRPTCRSALECTDRSIRSRRRPAIYDDDVERSGRSVCVVPLFRGKKQLVDVHVRVAATGKSEVLFYAGYAEILGQSMTVSSYVPRAFAILPTLTLSFLARVDLPNTAERFLQYFASISFGLAILNMAPVIYLDGEASVGLFLRTLFKKLSVKRVEKISALTLSAGSFLLALNLVVSLYSARPR